MSNNQKNNSIIFFYQYVEEVLKVNSTMTPEQAVSFYILSYSEYSIPSDKITELSKWFKSRFIEIYSKTIKEKRSMEKESLGRDFMSRASLEHKPHLKKAYIRISPSSGEVLKVEREDVLKYAKVYLIEKNDKDAEVLFYEFNQKEDETTLFKEVQNIPGLKINKKKNEDAVAPIEEKVTIVENPIVEPIEQKNETIPEAKLNEELKEDVSIEEEMSNVEVSTQEQTQGKKFSDTFSDRGASEKEESSLLHPSKYYLAIPSPYPPREHKWEILGKDGKFIPGSSLSDEIEKMKNEAKEKGARFDKEKGLWFIPPNTPLSTFTPFMAEEVEKSLFGKLSITDEQSLKINIQKDLAEAGLDLRGRNLEIDKGWQNVEIFNDHKNGRPGSYKISSEGVNIRMECFKHKGSLDRKNKLYKIPSRSESLDPNVVNVRTYFSEAISKARTANGSDGAVGVAEMEEWEENAKEIQAIFAKGVPTDPEHPYLVRKGLRGKIYTLKSPKIRNQKDADILVPLSDIHGKIWSIEHISSDPKNNKWTGLRGRRNSKQEIVKRRTRAKGCFYIVSQFPISAAGLGDIAFVAEGFSTAATMEVITSEPIMAVKSKGNIVPVLKAFFEEFPNKKAIIFADNDLGPKINNPKKNEGLIAAEKAVELFGEDRVAIIECKFSPEELKKGWSDFNDVFVELGEEELKRRVLPQLEEKIKYLNTPVPKKDIENEDGIYTGKTPP